MLRKNVSGQYLYFALVKASDGSALAGATVTGSDALTQLQNKIKLSPLYPYVPNIQNFHCPGDQRFKRPMGSTGWAWDSYSKADGMNGEGYGGRTPITKLAAIRQPNRMFVSSLYAGMMTDK